MNKELIITRFSDMKEPKSVMRFSKNRITIDRGNGFREGYAFDLPSTKEKFVGLLYHLSGKLWMTPHHFHELIEGVMQRHPDWIDHNL
jgi:hypothetical protein